MSNDRSDIFLDGTVVLDSSGNFSAFFESDDVDQVTAVTDDSAASIAFSCDGSTTPFGAVGVITNSAVATVTVPTRYFAFVIANNNSAMAGQTRHVSVRKYN